MIRNEALALTLLLFLALPLAAQDVPPAGLLDWGKQMVGYCPDETFDLTRADVPAPAGYTAWHLAQKSSWSACAQRLLLYASQSQNFAGRALPISIEPRPLEARLAEVARLLLGAEAKVTVGDKALPSGLKPIRILFMMPQGPLPMDAWVDPAGAHLMIGVAGIPGKDPGVAQLDAPPTGATVRGKKGSPVVILEISDLQCPGCAQLHQRLEPFLARNLDKVEYRRIDLPLFDQHDWTLRASSAGKAIQKVAPRAYWDYVDLIFKQQGHLTATTLDATIRDFAQANEISWKDLEAAMKSAEIRTALFEQVGKLYGYGIFSTPTIIVNGRIVPDVGDGKSVIAYVENLLREQ